MKSSLNDPKLTAYALGELHGQEAIEMKNLVEKDAEAQKYVEEVREAAQVLSENLQSEAAPELSGQERTQIVKLAARSEVQTPAEATVLNQAKAEKPAGKSKEKWWQFELRWLLAMPATAAVAILCVMLVPKVMRDHKAQTQITVSEPPSPPMTPEAKPGDYYRYQGDVKKAAPAASGESHQQDSQVPSAFQFKGSAVDSQDGEVAALRERRNVVLGAPAASMPEAEGLAAEPDSLQAPPPPAKTISGLTGLSAVKSKGAMRAEGKRAAFGGAGVNKEKHVGKLEADTYSADSGFNTESYGHIVENAFLGVSENPLSTFSTDVDTASYSNVRRMLVSSQLPPKDAVRIEEMINYFKYDYAQPVDGKPFAVHTELAQAPWNSRHQLVKIGIKGKEIASAERPATNLVFLLDVSGSMTDANKLPLVQNSLKMLVQNLREDDRVALVVYAGSTGLVLPSTSGKDKQKIIEALDRLQAGGSTNGGAGIHQAYAVAQSAFIKGGTNRVILATDGDFNVGTTSEGDLIRLVEEKAKTGVFLTVLGVGMGNYKDSMMQKIADKGNGNYAYVDTLREARKVLVEQAGGTLHTIAKDVKIQVEFNPAHVESYRLIGYEKRLLNKEDFNDDTKDAGEIGAGHTVIALYEVVPRGGADLQKLPKVDALKYQAGKKVESDDKKFGGELLTVKLRYKKPDGDKSELIEVPVKNEEHQFTSASSDLKFAASVAGFAMILRDSQYKGDFTLDQVIEIAGKNLKVSGQNDEYRAEFVELAKQARALRTKNK